MTENYAAAVNVAHGEYLEADSVLARKWLRGRDIRLEFLCEVTVLPSAQAPMIHGQAAHQKPRLSVSHVPTT